MPMPSAAPDPRAEYERRHAERSARAAAAGAAARRVSHARLAVFVVGLAVAGLAFGADRLPGWTVLVPVLAFAVLVVWHDRVLRRQRAAARAAAWYDDGLARLDARFAGRGAAGERFR